MLFIHDPERRSRPFHIADESANHPSYLFALCTAIFDVRPAGVTTVGHVESEDLICGLCLREQRTLMTPAEEAAWSSAARMMTEDHIPQADIAEAMRQLERWGVFA